jgi:hypothetical protein
MNRLRRFYEKLPYGRTSSRVAYATNVAALPAESSKDAEWTEDAGFNASEAIIADPLLAEVYKQAILKGCAYDTRAPKDRITAPKFRVDELNRRIGDY